MPPPKERTLFDQIEPGFAEPAIPFAVALLALGSVKGLGQKAIHTLVGCFGDDLGKVLSLNQADLAATFRECGIGEKFATVVHQETRFLLDQAEQELRELEARRIRVVSPMLLPDRLRSINGDAPHWLFVEGDEKLLHSRPVIAVVGTRNPSETGMEAARVIATILSPYPVVLVSGLAEGIDSQAHQASLQRGVKNVAFLGHGINLVFPESTADVRREIIQRGGAVVSEYLPNQSYQKRQFVARNRLQAAMADIVIPVEAAASSGTAHTIRFARRYYRTLLGVTWNGAQGVVEDLQEADDQIVEIFTSAGQRELDTVIQRLLASEKADTYPFKNLERMVKRELCNRTYTRDDVARLVDAINRESQLRKPQEPPNNGTA